ncbi:MAG: phosphoribosylanthranilate isomerase [candidate division KSB1 bacterium]|nr:phosphoribosylanthranilate isomerase [candidate division KSB1 bacterium]MDQ7064485.1 phosphoribosylanthranilate isomerase [candidate division KSB1 bacterium]
MVRVKICGITRLEDARRAVDLGADAVGFIFYRKSPRFVEPGHAAEISAQLPPGVCRVGVFVDTPPEAIRRIAREVPLHAIQFHGPYLPEAAGALSDFKRIGVVRVRNDILPEQWQPYRRHIDAMLLDTYRRDAYGGTGQPFAWQHAKQLPEDLRLILAGGLGPDNILQAINDVRPYAVDVNSGVESAPGVKDANKLHELFQQLRKVRRDWQRTDRPVFPIA